MTDLTTPHRFSSRHDDMQAFAYNLRLSAALVDPEYQGVELTMSNESARLIARTVEAGLVPRVETRIVEVPVADMLSWPVVLFCVFMSGVQAFVTLGDIALAIVRALP